MIYYGDVNSDGLMSGIGEQQTSYGVYSGIFEKDKFKAGIICLHSGEVVIVKRFFSNDEYFEGLAYMNDGTRRQGKMKCHGLVVVSGCIVDQDNMVHEVRDEKVVDE